MLWRIDGSNTYVLGSVHITNLKPLTLSNFTEVVFELADCVVFEADQNIAVDPSLITLPAGSRLDGLLDAEQFRRANEHWIRLGFSAAALLSFRPAMAAVTLQITESSRHGYFSELGVDRALRDEAESAQKRIDFLEDLNDQLRLLTNTPLAEQISFLDHIAKSPDVGFSELRDMVSANCRGDIRFFEDLLAERRKAWPQLVDAILTKRNENWVPKIIEMARTTRRTVIVVGVLHLVGETGLPALLEPHGLRLTRQREGC